MRLLTITNAAESRHRDASRPLRAGQPPRALAALVALLATPAIAVAGATGVDEARDPATAVAPTAEEFPAEWFWGSDKERQRHAEVVGKPAPPLSIARWHGEPVSIADQLGKVVVVDLWATWCGPCVRAIPENVEMVRELGDRGLVFVGVHDARRGHDRIDATIERSGINYPIGVDDGGRTARAYALAFWPTYAVIDRRGVVRAVGLQPQHVRAVVERLLAEPADAAPAPGTEGAAPGGRGSGPTDGGAEAVPAPKAGASVPATWLEGDGRARARLSRIDADSPPPLPVGTTWINSAPLRLDELAGKVVLLDFWATWCGPCRAAAPKLSALARRHAEDGLVVIGVCATKGAERMPQVVEDWGITYPVVADSGDATSQAYMVNGYPDYFVIDRAGRLRVLDCNNAMVQEAVEALLAE